jgi:hypothetical protein
MLPLTAEHKWQRLDWCRTQEHWDNGTLLSFLMNPAFVWVITTVGKGLGDDVVKGVILSFLWSAT